METDPWRLEYRVGMKKIGRQPAKAEACRRKREIIRALFPAYAIINWASIPFGLKCDVDRLPSPFTMAELNEAVKRLPAGRHWDQITYLMRY